ncbi:cardiac phospholamban isoform X1 [Phyllopteryx taeniolatus]|uniref:cardiac phospholamban isoform X1 n=1 Tax=Phyllopteryx taeniolatus TaxID=161469 RepID=UPI002AD44A40|nr:cardiac phospholamban isoform X1 [Phyllopteryx taeniolatus]
MVRMALPGERARGRPTRRSTDVVTEDTRTAKMERVQHITKSAIRRASQIEVTPQAKRNLQELFVNFTLILICLLLIYIIVLLSS